MTNASTMSASHPSRRARRALLAPTVLATVLVTLAGPAAAGDPARGRLLYENHCQACHTSTVHVRERHKAQSLGDIAQWVARWQAYLELGWGPEEVEDVTTWLAESQYGISGLR
ncbi:MAG: cytochrome C [Ectothiorhodospiraceae bacterium]|nr:cytochrome C [Chromatiales bacterium]MCP5153756.1 cytochrome C [Ectothiorhodospiraceae bacterium]